MAESTISNVEKNVQDINNLFIHILKPDYIPVGTRFEQLQNIDNLDKPCDQIIINDLLDYLSYNESMSVLDLIINKLKSGGEIIIQSTDLFQLSSSVTFSDIDIPTAKVILYSNKKHIYTMYEIESELKNRNLDIVEKKYINIIEYYIRAIKI